MKEWNNNPLVAQYKKVFLQKQAQTFYRRIKHPFHENYKHKLLTLEFETPFMRGILIYLSFFWHKPFSRLKNLFHKNP